MIQTYEPSSPGMIVCTSGGGYVETSAHLAAMEEKDKEITAWVTKHFEEMADKDRDSLALRNEIAALKAKLSRLTAALNDDERAEKVKGDAILHWNRSYILGRTEGINDYRAMLLKEVEK